MSEIKAGDVVQIDPTTNERFAGCLAIVEEVRSWGVVASVPIPAAPKPQQAPIRLQSGSYVRIGAAEWIQSL